MKTLGKPRFSGGGAPCGEVGYSADAVLVGKLGC